MGIFDRLFGRANQPQQGYGQAYPQQGYGTNAGPYATSGSGGANVRRQPTQTPGASMSEDERAIARYEYMLKTAPPEEIEKAHAEAFAKLTPEQRQQVLTRLATDSPEDAPRDDSPQSLARAATRAEMRRPGFLQQSFGGYGMSRGMGGIGMGGMGMGSMLLTSVAGAFVGTAIADAMFDGWGNDFDSHDMQDAYQDGYRDGEHEDQGDGGQGGDQGDGFADSGDYSAADTGMDSGSDFGGFDSGDFGGGDFGGDMGGFDF